MARARTYAILTLTNSTVSGNTVAGSGGGVFNDDDGTLTLTQTLVSGNTASALGPEAYHHPAGTNRGGTVVADNFNLFGHDGVDGVDGFPPGPTDLVPSAPLAAVLNPPWALHANSCSGCRQPGH